MAATELAIAGRNEAQIQRRQETAVDPFEPQDWQQLLALAKMVSQTDFAPKDFKGKPESCAIAMMYGKQLGVPAITALQGIGVINGRPNAFGDLFWAIILSHPEFEDVVEKDEDTKAYVKLTRRNRTPKEVTFTQKDAEIAGLWKKQGPWTNYPKAMLLWRARTIAARALFADALKGITSSYEAEDSGPIIDAAPLASTATPATENKPAAPQKISQDHARDFGKAWKASGFTIAQAKEKLKELCGVDSSLDITTDNFETAMQWATKNPNWPEVEPSPDEQRAREAMSIVGYDLERQAKAIDAHTHPQSGVDWTALFLSMRAELDAQE